MNYLSDVIFSHFEGKPSHVNNEAARTASHATAAHAATAHAATAHATSAHAAVTTGSTAAVVAVVSAATKT